MRTLFSDPLHWTASAVGTKARFTLMLTMQSLLIGLAVLDASYGGVLSAASVALFVIWMQFLLLYAMRAMYLQVVDPSASKRDAA